MKKTAHEIEKGEAVSKEHDVIPTEHSKQRKLAKKVERLGLTT